MNNPRFRRTHNRWSMAPKPTWCGYACFSMVFLDHLSWSLRVKGKSRWSEKSLYHKWYMSSILLIIYHCTVRRADVLKYFLWSSSFFLFIPFCLINYKMFSYSLYSNCQRADVSTPCFLTSIFFTLEISVFSASYLVGLPNWFTGSQGDICIGMKWLSPSL